MTCKFDVPSSALTIHRSKFNYKNTFIIENNIDKHTLFNNFALCTKTTYEQQNAKIQNFYLPMKSTLCTWWYEWSWLMCIRVWPDIESFKLSLETHKFMLPVKLEEKGNGSDLS